MAIILCIDDDPTVLEVMTVVLQEEGYEAKGFGPVEGLAYALTNPPALILLDMMMPALDGAALHNELLQHAQTAKVPVIIVTAWHDPAAWFAGLGPVAILAKPFELDELIACVQSALPKG